MISRCYHSVIFVVFEAALCNQAFAQQDVRAITLKQAVDAAIEKGIELKLSRLDQTSKEFRYKASSTWLLPQLKVSYSAINTNSPLTTFGLKLDQAKLSAPDFNPVLLNNPNSRFNFSPKADVYQAIFDLEKIFQKESARHLLSAAQFEEARKREQVTYDAKLAYFDLWLAYKSVEAGNASLLTSQQILSSGRAHYQQGLVLLSEVLDAEVMVSAARRNLIAAHSQLLDASKRLSLVMGQSSFNVYRPETDLQSIDSTVDTTQNIAAMRADFAALQKQIQASETQVKASRAGGLPVIYAFGDYSFNSPVVTGIGRGGYVIGMQLSWNVFNGNRLKNQASAEQIETTALIERLSQAKREAVARLHGAYRALADARAEYEQAALEEKAAQASMKILGDRFAQGLVSTADFSRASKQVTDAVLDKEKAFYTLNATQASLDFLLAGTNANR